VRRLVAHLVVFGLAGAILSLAVAWACAYWSSFESNDHFMLSIQHEWTSPKPAWWPEWDASDPRSAYSNESFWEDRGYGFGIRWVEWWPVPRTPPGLSVSFKSIAFETSAGWPMYCLRGQQLDPVMHPDLTATGWWAKSGILLDRRARDKYGSSGQTLMPLDPIWTGFLVDAISYGGLLWLVTFGLRPLRRLVRRTRGRCAACGYPLTALTTDRCPECGSANRGRSTLAQSAGTCDDRGSTARPRTPGRRRARGDLGRTR